MRRELGQLSLADGDGRGRRGAQPAAGADRGAGGLGSVRASVGRCVRGAGRAAVLRAGGAAALSPAATWYRLSDLDSRRRCGTALASGGSSASRWPTRCRTTRPSRAFARELVRRRTVGAAAGRAQPSARRARPGGQEWHPDRCLAWSPPMPADRARASRPRAAATPMPAGTPCRRSRCSATRCTSRSIKAPVCCAARSSRPPTSRTRSRSSLSSRATSNPSMPTRATTAGGTRRGLAERGIDDGIMAASYRQRPLDAAGHVRNRAIAHLRAPIERSFAILKRWYGYRRVRYRSLVKQRPPAAAAGARPEPAPRPGAHLLRVASASTLAAQRSSRPSTLPSASSAPLSRRLQLVPRQRRTILSQLKTL